MVIDDDDEKRWNRLPIRGLKSTVVCGIIATGLFAASAGDLNSYHLHFGFAFFVASWGLMICANILHELPRWIADDKDDGTTTNRDRDMQAKSPTDSHHSQSSLMSGNNKPQARDEEADDPTKWKKNYTKLGGIQMGQPTASATNLLPTPVSSTHAPLGASTSNSAIPAYNGGGGGGGNSSGGANPFIMSTEELSLFLRDVIEQAVIKVRLNGEKLLAADEEDIAASLGSTIARMIKKKKGNPAFVNMLRDKDVFGVASYLGDEVRQRVIAVGLNGQTLKNAEDSEIEETLGMTASREIKRLRQTLNE